MNVIVRRMEFADLPRVMEIQAACYFEVPPESERCVQSKFVASPDTCFVAQRGSQVIAYLFALPWRFDSPPELELFPCELPATPDCLYLHDLAVAPEARGKEAGLKLVQVFLAALDTFKLSKATLIAVQGTSLYWQRHGFREVAGTPVLDRKLASYGGDNRYMEFIAERANTDPEVVSSPSSTF